MTGAGDRRIALPAAMRDDASGRVHRALSADGAEVRFVGGCVRDALAGRAVKDVDLATPDRPETVIRLLGRAGLKAVPTGIEHGTVTAVAEGRGFEVTTLRVDVRTFGRHAEVAFTDDWQADAARRDFTFNAMSANADGRLHDYFGGEADLAAGRVRFVGEPQRRIAEDYLRVLRFFRFLAHFGREAPEAAALAACRDAAPELRRLSGERVRNELLKLLAAPDPVPSLLAMREAGVLAVVLPEAGGLDRLAALVGLEAEAGDALRRLAALVATGAPGVAPRLRLSNDQRDRLAFLVEGRHGITTRESARSLRQHLYRHGATYVIDALHLAFADGGLEERLRALVAEARAWTRPTFPLKGRDVIAAGVPKGPSVTALMAELEAWWMAGDFRADRAQCLAELQGRARAG